MKVFVAVDNVEAIPTKFRQETLIVTQSNWMETYAFLEGKTSEVRLYIHAEASTERLLKIVEDYRGNLVVYSAASASDVFLSRFTHTMNKCKLKKNKFPALSDMEKTLDSVKKGLVL